MKKKFFAYFMPLAVVTALAFGSCSGNNNGNDEKQATEEAVENATAILEKQIERTNKRLPMKSPDGSVTEKIVVDGDYVVMKFTFPDEKVDMDAFESGKDELKANIIANLTNSGADPVISNAVVAGKGIRYDYVGVPSERTVSIAISVDELAQIVSKPEDKVAE